MMIDEPDTILVKRKKKKKFNIVNYLNSENFRKLIKELWKDTFKIEQEMKRRYWNRPCTLPAL